MFKFNLMTPECTVYSHVNELIIAVDVKQLVTKKALESVRPTNLELRDLAILLSSQLIPDRDAGQLIELINGIVHG